MQVSALRCLSMSLDAVGARGGSTPPLRTSFEWRNHWETRGSALVVSGVIAPKPTQACQRARSSAFRALPKVPSETL